MGNGHSIKVNLKSIGDEKIFDYLVRCKIQY